MAFRTSSSGFYFYETSGDVSYHMINPLTSESAPMCKSEGLSQKKISAICSKIPKNSPIGRKLKALTKFDVCASWVTKDMVTFKNGELVKKIKIVVR